jgi:hypothetical protein
LAQAFSSAFHPLTSSSFKQKITDMAAISKKMTTVPDAAHDYICTLETQVKAALAELKNASATRDVAFSKYNKTLAWLEQLKVYCLAIEKTNLHATALIAILENAINQACIVADSASFGVDALRYLLLDLKKVGCCVEKLVAKADELKAKFPALDATDPIMVAHKNLQDALNDAFTCIKDAIAALLTNLEMTELLVTSLADSTDSPGLTGYLEILKDDFATGDNRSDYLPACSFANGCNDIVFPLTVVNSPYFKSTTQDCQNVENEIYATGGLLEKYETAQNDMNAKKTCYEALKAALDAAKAAKTCAKK